MIGLGNRQRLVLGGAPSARAAAVNADQTGALYAIKRLLGSSSTLALLSGTNGNLMLSGNSIVATTAIGAGSSQTAIVREISGQLAVEYPVVLTGKSEATPTPTPTPSLSRLAFSAAIAQDVPVDDGTTLLSRTAGSTLAYNFPGLTIDNDTGAVSGTPTTATGLIAESLSGVERSTLLSAPRTGGRSMKVGMNVAGFYFYQVNNIWLDYLKASQEEHAPATADANGVPQTLDASPASRLIPLDDGTETPVTYRLLTDGDIDAFIQGVGDGGATVSFTADENERLIATYTGLGCRNLGCYFRITAIRTAPTYIHLAREEDADRLLAGHVYKESWINFISNFSRARLMTWNMTNNPNYTALPDDALSFIAPAYDDDGNVIGHEPSVPLKHQVDLCIEAGVDGWFNLPAKITDSEFEAMWPEFDRLRAAGRSVYIEYSNEVWNRGFYQSLTYAPEQFDATPGATIDNDFRKNDWWNGYRSQQLAALSQGRGYGHVIGSQPVDQGEDYGGPRYIKQGMEFAGGTDYSDFVAWTTTTYSGGDWDQPVSPDGITQERYDYQIEIVARRDFDRAFDININYVGPHSLSVLAIRTYLDQAKGIADKYNLKLVAYEGNATALSSTFNYGSSYGPGTDQFFYDMANHELAAPTVVANLQQADDAGMDELMYFDADSQPADSQYGVYGVYGRPSADGLLSYLSRAYAPPVGVGYRYFRITCTGDASVGDYTNNFFRWGTAEVVFKNGEATLAPSGFSATSSADADNLADRAVDGSTANSFLTNSGAQVTPPTLTIDTGEGNSVKPTAFDLWQVVEADAYSFATGSVEGSSDGSKWDTLATVDDPATYTDSVFRIPLTYPD